MPAPINPWSLMLMQQQNAQAQVPLAPTNQGQEQMVPMDINPQTGEPMILDPALMGAQPDMPPMSMPSAPPGMVPSFTQSVTTKSKGPASEIQMNQNRELLDLAKQYDLKNKEFIASQQLGIDQLQQDYNQAKAQESPMNLVPLAALSDAWNPGSNLTAAAQAMSYESPAQRQQRLMGLGEKLQARKADLAKANASALKEQIEAYKAAKDQGLNDEVKRAQIMAYKAAAGQKADKFTPLEESRDKDFGKEYADWNAKGGYATVEKNLNKLEEVKASLQKNPDLLRSATAWAPESMGIQAAVNPDLVAIKQKVAQAVQASLRQTLGPQFTEKEGQQIIERSFDPKLSLEDNMDKLDATINEIKTMAMEKERASRYAEQNKSLRGYTPGKQSILEGSPPQGQTYTDQNGTTYELRGKQWVKVKK